MFEVTEYVQMVVDATRKEAKTVGDWLRILQALPSDMEIRLRLDGGECPLSDTDQLLVDFVSNTVYVDTVGGPFKDEYPDALPYRRALLMKHLTKLATPNETAVAAMEELGMEVDPITPRLLDVLAQANAGLVRITKLAMQAGEIVELEWEDA